MTRLRAWLQRWWAEFNRTLPPGAGPLIQNLPAADVVRYPVKQWQRTTIVSELRAHTAPGLFGLDGDEHEKNHFIERSVHQLFDAADAAGAQVGPWQFSEWADHASFRPTLRWQVWAPIVEGVLPTHVEFVLKSLEEAAATKRNVNEIVLLDFHERESLDAVA